MRYKSTCFQFLGIPPKGEQRGATEEEINALLARFQFLGIPPKGEHKLGRPNDLIQGLVFPISRDPPEGGTG